MTLLLDATHADEVIVGLLKGRIRTLRRFSRTARSHEELLRGIDTVLRSHKASLSDITECCVVAGPGKFSQLRVAATVANICAWANGWKLYSLRASRYTPSLASGYLEDILRHRGKTQKQITPRYGQAPHITTPKKRRS